MVAPVLGVLVIVPGRGLVPAGERIDAASLRAMAEVPVDVREPRYAEPLMEDARKLADALRGR